jgi:hypothetical protein
MFRRLTEELAVSLIAWKRTRNTSAGLRSIARVYRPKISLDAAQSFPHSQASTRERVMTYTAAVDRSSFPAFVSKSFKSKAGAVLWAKSQGGYNAVVYRTVGWQNVWVA